MFPQEGIRYEVLASKVSYFFLKDMNHGRWLQKKPSKIF